MTDVQLTLSAEERDALLRLVETALSEKRVEVRRTEFSFRYREDLQHEGAVLAGLLEKLRQLPAPAGRGGR